MIMDRNTFPEEKFERFCVLHRLMHLAVLIGFVCLAVTGMSLALSSQGWARGVMWLLGGVSGAGALHRFFAVTTYSCVIIYVLWFCYYRFVLKGSLFGPTSLFPRLDDLRHLRHHVRYFLGKEKTIPAFNRFTYWEKFDYWAFFLGMNTMGVTGLFLWFPEFFTRFFPGYFINLAQVLHLLEAIMAISLKFVVHMITAHLRPGIYPVEKSIFTGKIEKEKLIVDHPAEWEMMLARQETES